MGTESGTDGGQRENGDERQRICRRERDGGGDGK